MRRLFRSGCAKLPKPPLANKATTIAPVPAPENLYDWDEKAPTAAVATSPELSDLPQSLIYSTGVPEPQTTPQPKHRQASSSRASSGAPSGAPPATPSGEDLCIRIHLQDEKDMAASENLSIFDFDETLFPSDAMTSIQGLGRSAASLVSTYPVLIHFLPEASQQTTAEWNHLDRQVARLLVHATTGIANRAFIVTNAHPDWLGACCSRFLPKTASEILGLALGRVGYDAMTHRLPPSNSAVTNACVRWNALASIARLSHNRNVRIEIPFHLLTEDVRSRLTYGVGRQIIGSIDPEVRLVPNRPGFVHVMLGARSGDNDANAGGGGRVGSASSGLNGGVSGCANGSANGSLGGVGVGLGGGVGGGVGVGLGGGLGDGVGLGSDLGVGGGVGVGVGGPAASRCANGAMNCGRGIQSGRGSGVVSEGGTSESDSRIEEGKSKIRRVAAPFITIPLEALLGHIAEQRAAGRDTGDNDGRDPGAFDAGHQHSNPYTALRITPIDDLDAFGRGDGGVGGADGYGGSGGGGGGGESRGPGEWNQRPHMRISVTDSAATTPSPSSSSSTPPPISGGSTVTLAVGMSTATNGTTPTNGTITIAPMEDLPGTPDTPEMSATRSSSSSLFARMRSPNDRPTVRVPVVYARLRPGLGQYPSDECPYSPHWNYPVPQVSRSYLDTDRRTSTVATSMMRRGLATVVPTAMATDRDTDMGDVSPRVAKVAEWGGCVDRGWGHDEESGGLSEVLGTETKRGHTTVAGFGNWTGGDRSDVCSASRGSERKGSRSRSRSRRRRRRKRHQRSPSSSSSTSFAPLGSIGLLGNDDDNNNNNNNDDDDCDGDEDADDAADQYLPSISRTREWTGVRQLLSNSGVSSWKFPVFADIIRDHCRRSHASRMHQRDGRGRVLRVHSVGDQASDRKCFMDAARDVAFMYPNVDILVRSMLCPTHRPSVGTMSMQVLSLYRDHFLSQVTDVTAPRMPVSMSLPLWEYRDVSESEVDELDLVLLPHTQAMFGVDGVPGGGPAGGVGDASEEFMCFVPHDLYVSYLMDSHKNRNKPRPLDFVDVSEPSADIVRPEK